MSQYPQDEIVGYDEDASEETVSETPKADDNYPNRERRAVFVFGSWILAFVAMVGFAHFGSENSLTKTVVDGCSTYLIAVAGFYIAGHSVDVASVRGRARRYFGGEQ